MKYYNERGSVPILGIILLLVLAGVAGVAIYNYNSSRTKNIQTAHATPTPSASPSASASPMATPAPIHSAEGGRLVLGELGATITLSTATNAMGYMYRHHDAVAGRTAFDTADFGVPDAVGAGCSYGYLGQAQKVPGNIPAGFQANSATDSSGSKKSYLKQFNGYYVVYVPPQNACSQAPESPSSYDVATAVSTFQPN